MDYKKGMKSGDSIFFFWYSLIAFFKAPLNTCIKNMESQIIRSLETKKQIETIAKRTSRRNGCWRMDKYDKRL